MKTAFLLLFLAVSTWAVQATPQTEWRYTVNVDQPRSESFTIVSYGDEVSSIKRDVDIPSQGKTVEVGYHIQITPHLSDPVPNLRIYVKSIIADPTANDEGPGFRVRTQTLKVVLSQSGKKWVGEGTCFTVQPVSFRLELTKLSDR